MKKESLFLRDILRENKFINNSNCFETKYVNSNEWIENLFDSISRDFPIGIFVIKESGDSIYNKFKTILNGQNRINTILRCLINPKYSDRTDLIPLCFDLTSMTFKISDVEDSNLVRVFRITDTYCYLDLCDKIKLECNNDKYKYNPIINKLQNLTNKFNDFEMYYCDVSYETESNINLLLSRI